MSHNNYCSFSFQKIISYRFSFNCLIINSWKLLRLGKRCQHQKENYTNYKMLFFHKFAANVPPVAAGRVRSTKVKYFPFTLQTELKTHSLPQNISLAATGCYKPFLFCHLSP